MIGLWLANIIGFIYHFRRIIAITMLAAAVVIAVVLVMRSCDTSQPPQLSNAEIIAAQEAIAHNDREKMLQVLAESDARVAMVDKSLDEAKRAVDESVTKTYQEWSSRSNEELAAELERRAVGRRPIVVVSG